MSFCSCLFCCCYCWQIWRWIYLASQTSALLPQKKTGQIGEKSFHNWQTLVLLCWASNAPRYLSWKKKSTMTWIIARAVSNVKRIDRRNLNFRVLFNCELITVRPTDRPASSRPSAVAAVFSAFSINPPRPALFLHVAWLACRSFFIDNQA